MSGKITKLIKAWKNVAPSSDCSGTIYFVFGSRYVLTYNPANASINRKLVSQWTVEVSIGLWVVKLICMLDLYRFFEDPTVKIFPPEFPVHPNYPSSKMIVCGTLYRFHIECILGFSWPFFVVFCKRGKIILLVWEKCRSVFGVVGLKHNRGQISVYTLFCIY